MTQPGKDLHSGTRTQDMTTTNPSTLSPACHMSGHVGGHKLIRRCSLSAIPSSMQRSVRPQEPPLALTLVLTDTLQMRHFPVSVFGLPMWGPESWRRQHACPINFNSCSDVGKPRTYALVPGHCRPISEGTVAACLGIGLKPHHHLGIPPQLIFVTTGRSWR